MARILIVEPVAPAGIEALGHGHETDVRLNLPPGELLQVLTEGGGYDALVVRSQTTVDADVLRAGSPRLAVIGVASIGVDKIDLDAATRAGVMVVNAPTGNTIAAAEHTMSLMLALVRRVPAADASIRRGEWRRGELIGAELRGRTLGIIGLGKIGKQVCRRALAFDMKVLTHDPYITEGQASEVGARLVGLPELLQRADIISVHTPLTEQTRGIIGRAQLAAMKRGVYLVNVARGGILDESALAEALASGQAAGAALDVFTAEPISPKNPLLASPNTILTPHLGAATHEAQARVGQEIAQQVIMALAGVTPPYAVNAPVIGPDAAPRLRPYVELARRLAILARQLTNGPISNVALTYAGDIASWEISPVRTAALAGLLEAVTDQRVNAVNADLIARERGLTVRETRMQESEPWASLLTLELASGDADARLRLAGSTAHGRPHLVSLDGFEINAELSGTVLITRHFDRPGVVGVVGTVLAEAGVNISSLELSRLSAAGEATMFVRVDDPVPGSAIQSLEAQDAIIQTRVIELPPE